MKVAVCVMNSYMSIPPKTKRHEVWVEDSAKIGDSICDTVVGALRIIDFTGVTDKPAVEIPLTEMIPALELEVNDEFMVDGSWARVTKTNKEQGTYYMYVDAVSLLTGRKLPSQKIPKKSQMEIKSRAIVMSMALITSHDMVKALQAKLIDYQALNDAPARIEVVPTVFIDKEPAMKALKDIIKAEYSKLGEQIKKL